MKNLILIAALVMTSLSASATSYWYDYCNAVIPAYELMREYHPEVDIAPEAKCTNFYYANEIPACKQSLESLGLFKNSAKFKVTIKTENGGYFQYLVKFKAQWGGNCKLTKVKLLSKPTI